MSDVGLLFVGAVLFLNGLLFLGQADAKAVAVFNLFVGALQVAVPFYLIAQATAGNGPAAVTTNDILGDAGIFLFGFTYLYVGIVNLAGLKSDGIGWYSLWVAVMAAGFGLTEILRFHATTTGLLWLQWSVLWFSFFLVLALGRAELTRFAGWLTLVQSLTTCTIPGFLLLLGYWGDVPVWAVIAAIVTSAVIAVPLGLRGDSGTADAPEAAIAVA